MDTVLIMVFMRIRIKSHTLDIMNKLATSTELTITQHLYINHVPFIMSLMHLNRELLVINS
jgi:hypothetical protein